MKQISPFRRTAFIVATAFAAATLTILAGAVLFSGGVPTGSVAIAIPAFMVLALAVRWYLSQRSDG
ncbi:MAG: hypothetical protein AAGO57_07950 [Pseudomonadota bacterium]